MTVAMSKLGATPAREQMEKQFLDAAERLLVRVGYASITTRLLAAEAKANHGLVHYYFGSLEEVLVRVLDRFTANLIARQRAMYEADVPFIEKWRTAWQFQEEDLEAGYPKIWFELQAMSWNRPELRARIERVNAEWRQVLTLAFGRAAREYGVEDEFPPAVTVPLVMTMALGYMAERLTDVRKGHEPMLAYIDDWLVSLEARRGGKNARRARAGGCGETGKRKRRS
jgi:AcrR family transcriptional regulator